MSLWSRIKQLWSGKERGALDSATPASAQAAPLPGVARKVLVVDDDAVIVKTLSLALESKGYQVCTAADGAEAVGAARRAKPDLILLDINFPPDVAHGGGVPWDGFRILEWLRRSSEGRTIPIIIITGDNPAKFEGQARASGVVAFFQKPVNKEDLLRVIQQTLASSPTAAKG